MIDQRHGGDAVGFQREYGAFPLDFSVNVSPLGLPSGVREAVLRSLEEAWHYPDPRCRELRERLGELHALPADRIVVGNGAADLIHRLTQLLRPRRALLTSPGFGEYKAALTACGCEIERFFLRPENDFVLTEDILPRIQPGIELMILCSPDNPSGRRIAPELLRSVLSRCRETGTLLVLDECFLEFCPQPEHWSLAGLVENTNQLLVLRAFTKAYGMAGLRLGYALCGDESLARQVREWGQPWAVSSPAQAAGLAALEDREYLPALQTLIQKERAYLAAELQRLGLHVIPGEANFLLWRSDRSDLFDALCARGILARSCISFEGLDAHWLRTAVRTHEDNVTLIHALEEVLRHG